MRILNALFGLSLVFTLILGLAWFVAETAAQDIVGDGFVCPPCGCSEDGRMLADAGTCSACGMALVSSSELRSVAIVIYDGVELLDFAGPGEVFAAARSFQVFTVSASMEPINSQGFVQVTPGYDVSNSPKPDILIVPGGGTSQLLGSEPLMAWIKESAKDAEVVMSVCTGAFALAEVGLLDGQEVTTHYSAIDGLKKSAPKATVHENKRFVDNGKIITTAGVSAGIDGALHIVARLLGKQAAVSTARYMEYDKWEPGAGLVLVSEE